MNENDFIQVLDDNMEQISEITAVPRVNVAPVEQEERVTESSNSILSEEDEAFLNELIENQHL